MVPFLLWFILYFEVISKIQAPGGLYSEGILNGGFFAFRLGGGGGGLIFGGAYTWRGLFLEFYSIKDLYPHIIKQDTWSVYAGCFGR